MDTSVHRNGAHRLEVSAGLLRIGGRRTCSVAGVLVRGPLMRVPGLRFYFSACGTADCMATERVISRGGVDPVQTNLMAR